MYIQVYKVHIIYIIHSLNLFPLCSLKEFLPKEYVKSKNIEKKIKEVRYNNNQLNPEFFLAAFERQGYRNDFVECNNNIIFHKIIIIIIIIQCR